MFGRCYSVWNASGNCRFLVPAADRVDLMRELPESIRDRVAADECLLDAANAFELLQPPRACGIKSGKLERL